MLEDFLSMYPNRGANSPNKSTLCLHRKPATDSKVHEKTTDIIIHPPPIKQLQIVSLEVRARSLTIHWKREQNHPNCAFSVPIRFLEFGLGYL